MSAPRGADVLGDVLGEELMTAGGTSISAGGLGSQNRHAGFEIGRLDVGHVAPLERETGATRAWRSRSPADRWREDDLFAGLEDVLKYEELSLDALLVAQKLHIVQPAITSTLRYRWRKRVRLFSCNA